MLLLLYILWIILNGKITLEICLVGMAVVAIAGLIAAKLLDYSVKTELRLIRNVPLFVAYLAVLLWEIMKANFAVLRFIVNEKAHIEPALVSFDVELKSSFARYILANSITLTPGTITVITNGSRFTVHCLEEHMIDGIESGAFVRLLKRMEA